MPDYQHRGQVLYFFVCNILRCLDGQKHWHSVLAGVVAGHSVAMVEILKGLNTRLSNHTSRKTRSQALLKNLTFVITNATATM